MQSTTITRATFGTLTALLTAAIGLGIHESNQADASAKRAEAWRAEATAWQASAQQAVQANRQLAAELQNAGASVQLVPSDLTADEVSPAPAAPPTSQRS